MCTYALRVLLHVTIIVLNKTARSSTWYQVDSGATTALHSIGAHKKAQQQVKSRYQTRLDQQDNMIDANGLGHALSINNVYQHPGYDLTGGLCICNSTPSQFLPCIYSSISVHGVHVHI